MALSSRADMAGVSSMKIGDSDSFPAAVTSLGQSVCEKKPVLTLWALTLAMEQSILWASWSFDISRLKYAHGTLATTPACSSIDIARALLPMEGRPATTMRSDFWKPAVMTSRS